QTQNLNARPGGLINERQMLVEHPLLDLVGRAVERNVRFGLNESAPYRPRHEMLLLACRAKAPEGSEGGTVFLHGKCVKKRIIRVSNAANTEGPWQPTCRLPLPGCG